MRMSKLEREKRSQLRKKVGERLDILRQSVRDAEYGLLFGKNTPEQLMFAKKMLREEHDKMLDANRGVAKQMAWVAAKKF